MADLTIADAALRLGISKQAMRTRVRRGRIEAHKDSNGQWLVAVPDDTPPPASDIGPDASDADTDARADVGTEARYYNADAVIQTLREQLTVKDKQISELHVLLQTAQQNEQRLLRATIPEPAESPESPREVFVPDRPAQTPNVDSGAPGEAERASGRAGEAGKHRGVRARIRVRLRQLLGAFEQ